VDHFDALQDMADDPLKLDPPSPLEKGEPDLLGWLVFSGSRI